MQKNNILSNLIIENRPRLYRIAINILKNYIDAEDAVSEATCKAYENFHKLKDIEKFKPWIIKILINEAYSISNKRKKYVPLNDEIIVNNSDSEIIDNIILWDAVQTLDENFRVVAILFYYENMSIKEISKALTIPEGTVNSRLNRTRQKLKNIFLKEGVALYE